MSSQPDAVLLVEKGLSDTSVIPLDQESYVLGKSARADILIDNPYASRRHAEIYWEKGVFRIRDLDSKNGTFINGTPLKSHEQAWARGATVSMRRAIDKVTSGSTSTTHQIGTTRTRSL
jgi:pSer/pThr/pTyr-binding forkhead associated (FHA) protein